MSKKPSKGQKKVLITGVSGFLGVNVTERILSDTGFIVCGLADKVPDEAKGLFKKWLSSGRFRFYKADFIDHYGLERVVKKASPDYVIHLGGYVDTRAGYEVANLCMDVNIKGTLNLLEALKGAPVKRFVFASTAEVYARAVLSNNDKPRDSVISPYGMSKLAAEMLCRLYAKIRKMPVVILRFSNAYGPFQRPEKVIPMIILNSLKGSDILLKSPHQKCDFIFVDDISRAIIMALSSSKAENSVIDIANGKGREIYEVTKNIITKLKSKSRILYEKDERVIRSVKYFPGYSRAKRVFGWFPEFDFDSGLNKTISWYRMNPVKPHPIIE